MNCENRKEGRTSRPVGLRVQSKFPLHAARQRAGRAISFVLTLALYSSSKSSGRLRILRRSATNCVHSNGLVKILLGLSLDTMGAMMIWSGCKYWRNQWYCTAIAFDRGVIQGGSVAAKICAAWLSWNTVVMDVFPITGSFKEVH